MTYHTILRIYMSPDPSLRPPPILDFVTSSDVSLGLGVKNITVGGFNRSGSLESSPGILAYGSSTASQEDNSLSIFNKLHGCLNSPADTIQVRAKP